MQVACTAPERLKRMYGWIGAICWILILPAKEVRRLDLAIDPTVIGIAPSLLGPAGLVLVILSSERRFARLTIVRATLMSGTIALGLEFAQVLPLVRGIYTFDWLDVAATLFSLSAGVLVGAGLRRWYGAVS
jgi:hypothetical protein